MGLTIQDIQEDYGSDVRGGRLHACPGIADALQLLKYCAEPRQCQVTSKNAVPLAFF